MDASITIRLLGLGKSEQDSQGLASRAVSESREVEVSDEALMIGICDGSREALALLFRRYARLVRTVAMRILRDGSEADDLLQDVFLFIHRNCSVFDSSKAAVRSWIVQMTYHRAIDRRRYLNTRHFYTRLDLEGVTNLPASRAENRESEAFLGRLVGNTTVQGLLDTLSDDQRNTLSLHFFEGFTFDEIAEKLEQPLGNIRNHYYRGLDKLRKQVFSGKVPGRNRSGRK
jgi:RNA polymerase sigma-70 factor (ECF subfamily)